MLKNNKTPLSQVAKVYGLNVFSGLFQNTINLAKTQESVKAINKVVNPLVKPEEFKFKKRRLKKGEELKPNELNRYGVYVIAVKNKLLTPIRYNDKLTYAYEVVYVGKGVIDRPLNHFTSNCHNHNVRDTVNLAHNAGYEVEVFWFTFGLNEEQAFAVEEELTEQVRTAQYANKSYTMFKNKFRLVNSQCSKTKRSNHIKIWDENGNMLMDKTD